MNVHRFHLKCMACGLHYQVYSEHEKWPLRPLDHNGLEYGWCPECGTEGRTKMVWHEVLEKTFIFQHVPGDAGRDAGTLIQVGVPYVPRKKP